MYSGTSVSGHLLNKGINSEHQNSLSYCASTFVTSEERTRLYNGQNNVSPLFRGSTVVHVYLEN